MRENEIHKIHFTRGNRTYFFDLKMASNDSLYLKISERKKVKSDKFEGRNIMVFEEELDTFIDHIVEISGLMKNALREKHSGSN